MAGQRRYLIGTVIWVLMTFGAVVWAAGGCGGTDRADSGNSEVAVHAVTR
jgi:hypothetical protein